MMSSYPVLGIDVSRYQAAEDGTRRFDWEKAKRKVYFAYLRAGVGAAGVDFQFNYNLQECNRLGIACGVYHYLKPAKDWKKQADLFAMLAAPDGKPAGALPPALDVEETGGLDKNALGGYLEKFVKRFEAESGLSLMIYTSPGFWNKAVPLTSWAKNRALWVAHWGVDEPALPDEWVKISRPRTWKFWQTTSKGDGAAYGSTGDDDIDLDVYHGSLAEFNKEYGLSLKPLGEAPEEPVEPGYPCRMKVLGERINLRNAPNLEPASDVGDLAKGKIVTATGESGDGAWCKVEGWAYKSLLQKI